ncbi:MAG: right-handed parallel beta-helix repeat-containing protein [Candidatus Thermoplasmatota archaeon]
MRKAALVISIIAGVLVLSAIVVLVGNCGSATVREVKFESSSKALTSHAPIYIEGNADFTAANGVVSGTGGATDPYIIENWDINASTAHGVHIRNTTAYFVIRNCTIRDGKTNNYDGIYFYNVTNGKIENVMSYNNSGGILLCYSSDSNLNANQIYNNPYGIYLYSSSNNIINANQIYNNYDGISLSYSSSNKISSNQIYENSLNGIYFHKASSNNLISNQIYNNDDGIDLYYSSNNNLSANQIYNNSYGIELDFLSNNNQMSANQIYNNDRGIYLYSSSNNSLSANQIYNNSKYGIYLYLSSNNKIIDNIFTNDGIFIGGNLDDCVQTIENNTVNGKPLYYFLNQDGLILDGIAVGQLILVNCTNFNIKNLAISYTDVGIELLYSSNSALTNCPVYNNFNGVYLSYSSDNQITNCAVYNNSWYGIWLHSSLNNSISANQIYNNYWNGIFLGCSSNNSIAESTIYNNDNNGIVLESSSNNNQISNCTICNNGEGIWLGFSSNNNITDCTIYNNNDGIALESSSNNNRITTCKIYNNSYSGIWQGYYSNNSQIANCNIYNNSVYGVYLNSSNNNIIANNTISNNNEGIYSEYSSNNTLRNNTVYNNTHNGIGLWSSSNNNTIINNDVSCNEDGITVHSSSGNTIVDNNVYSNEDFGIGLIDSDENNVTQNLANSNAYFGIILNSANNNTITYNNVSNNAYYGIVLWYSSNSNHIHHNNFINNLNQANDTCSNTWDNGYPSGGNYWSDYTGVDLYSGVNQDQPGSDGIGDTPYPVLGGTSQDNYPLMSPLGIPQANFTWSPVSPTDLDLIQFTDTSTDVDGYIIAWYWEFGDGNISTLQNPTHQYADDGTYWVNLTVTDDDGATDTISKSIAVANVAPTANFTYSPVSPTTADTIQFSDTSTDFDGTIVSWYWEFGDGSTSTLPNPQHQYADNGTYWVNLTVTDDDGATDTISKSIAVANVAPTANFTWSPVSPITADIIQFSDASTDTDGTIVSWYWEFGDGSTSTLPNPQHQYADDGTYYVNLTVTDDDGAVDTAHQIIIVSNVPPIANFTYYQGFNVMDGENVNITLRVAGAKGIVNLTIKADNISIANLSVIRTPGSPQENITNITINASKNYIIFIERLSNQSGASSVWVIVECMNITCNVHRVFNAPPGQYNQTILNLTELLDFMVRSVGLVKFDASCSHDPDGSIINYTWDFGDNTTGYGKIVYHNYTYGNYTVVLTVKDDDNATNTTQKNVSIIDITGHYASYKTQNGVSLHSPADLTIKDNLGRVIGYSDINQTFENWVPDACMVICGELEFYLLPREFVYSYHVAGKGLGYYTFNVFSPMEYSPGEYNPDEYRPWEYGGKTYTLESSVSEITIDNLTLSADGNILSITGNEEKAYSLIVKNGTDTFTLAEIPINKGATHHCRINEWEALETSAEAVTLSIDENSDDVIDATVNIGSGLLSKNVLMVMETEIEGRKIKINYKGISIVTISETTQVGEALAGKEFIGIFIKIESTENISSINITIQYKASDIQNVKESSLKMYYWNETEGKWQSCDEIGSTDVDTENDIVWANVTHLTIFAPMAEKIAKAPAPVNWFLYLGILAIIVILAASLITAMKRKKKLKEGT